MIHNGVGLLIILISPYLGYISVPVITYVVSRLFRIPPTNMDSLGALAIVYLVVLIAATLVTYMGYSIWHKSIQQLQSQAVETYMKIYLSLVMFLSLLVLVIDAYALFLLELFWTIGIPLGDSSRPSLASLQRISLLLIRGEIGLLFLGHILVIILLLRRYWHLLRG